MNRTQRRALAHQQSESTRKLITPPDQPALECPEPGAPFPSLAKLNANRENAKRSTGPTEASFPITSQNRTVHGLARHNGAFKLLPTEDANGFEAFKNSLIDEHAPSTPTESILVNTIAESHWLANRAQRLQDACFDEQTGQIANEKMFSVYLRYQTTHTRAFHKALNDLLKLRSERRKEEFGFEAQRIQNERHEMKKQTHYWDVLRKDGEACHQIAQNTLQNLQAAEQSPGFEAQFTAALAQRGLERGNFNVAAPAAA